jgi:hypothetical protein
MKNEKLENAKSKIVEFYDKHETAIKIDGCSVTQDGLEILKAVIDNPVIVDR